MTMIWETILASLGEALEVTVLDWDRVFCPDSTRGVAGAQIHCLRHLDLDQNQASLLLTVLHVRNGIGQMRLIHPFPYD